MSVQDNDPIYPISVAAKLVDVHPRTLRIYENEGLIKPARQGNKRYYSKNDITWIKCFRHLIHDQGISIPGIKLLLDLSPCWVITKCPQEKRTTCSAFVDRSLPCWKTVNRNCKNNSQACETCIVFTQAMEAARQA